MHSYQGVRTEHELSESVVEPGADSARGEAPPRHPCAVAVALLFSIIFGGLVVCALGSGIQQLWITTMWSTALFLWAIRYWQPWVINSFVDCVCKCIEMCPCATKAYADANLSYEFVDFMQQHKFLTANILTLGSFGMGGAVAHSAGQWMHNLQLSSVTDLHLMERGNATIVSTTKHDMVYVLTHPAYSCEVVGLVPMPCTHLLMKLTFCGFLQDLVFGSKDLLQCIDQPIAIVSKAFVAYQIATLLLVYGSVAHDVWTGRIIGSPWSIYQIIVYKIPGGNSFTNAILLACKMLVETNVHKESGSPHSFDRLERYNIPYFASAMTKANVFWMSTFLLAVAGLPILLTHTIPAVVFSCCALTFPFWGAVCLVLSCFHSPFRAAVSIWAEVHAEVWGIFALFTVLAVSSMLLREKLWRIQCHFAGERVNGFYGYTKATMTLFFAVPTVFCFQSFPTWAVLGYGGWALNSIPFTAFNLRVIHEYNSCFISGTGIEQLLKWLCLI